METDYKAKGYCDGLDNLIGNLFLRETVQLIKESDFSEKDYNKSRNLALEFMEKLSVFITETRTLSHEEFAKKYTQL